MEEIIMRVKKFIAGAAAAALVLSLETMSVFAAGPAAPGYNWGHGCYGGHNGGYGTHHNPYCAVPGSGVYGNSYSGAGTTAAVYSAPSVAATPNVVVVAPNPPADTAPVVTNPIVYDNVANNAYNYMYNGAYNGGHHNEYNGGRHSGGHH